MEQNPPVQTSINELNLPQENPSGIVIPIASSSGLNINEKNTYFRSKIVRRKLLTIIIGIICLGVGYSAHQNALWKEIWDKDTVFTRQCRTSNTCPSYAIIMEQYFVIIVFVSLVLSIYSIAKIAGSADYSERVKDDIKGVDRAFHAISGMLLLAAGVLIIVAATRIRAHGCTTKTKFKNLTTDPDTDTFDVFIMKSLEKCDNESIHKFVQKCFAGIIAVINGVIYILISRLLSDRKMKGLLGSLQSIGSSEDITGGSANNMGQMQGHPAYLNQYQMEPPNFVPPPPPNFVPPPPPPPPS